MENKIAAEGFGRALNYDKLSAEKVVIPNNTKLIFFVVKTAPYL